MPEFIETAGRVFQIDHEPTDVPPDLHCARRIIITIVSGPPLEQEEYERITAQVIADIVGQGIDVIGWGTPD
jgi:hypothetical protein